MGMTPPGLHAGQEHDNTAIAADGKETAGRAKRLENKIRSRIEEWAGDVGYWGQAANIVVGESDPSDHSASLMAATFQLGTLSFHFDCIQDEKADDFQVGMRGTEFQHISDRDTLDRAMRESRQSRQ